MGVDCFKEKNRISITGFESAQETQISDTCLDVHVLIVHRVCPCAVAQ